MGTVLEEPEPRAERRPLSSVLTEAASSRDPAPKALERKRGFGAAQTSPATKRHRPRQGRTSVPREREEGEAPAQNQPLTEEEWEQRLQKRRTVVQSHKRRPDYQAFNQARPRGEREFGEPMTPDPELRTSKRQWESEVQHWRQGIREWNNENGNDGDANLDDAISESPN